MGTRLTLAAKTREHIYEEDADNSHFTDAQIYDYVNQGIRQLGTDLEWPIQLAQATGVENQSVYALPTDFISLTNIYYDNAELIIIDRGDLTQINAKWQDAESGIPKYAYKQDNRKIGLYPKPSSEQAGLDIQIWYVKLPPDLSDDTTSPDLHIAFQDCVPFYAAWLCEHKMGNTKRANTNLAYYDDHKKRIQAKLQRFSDGLMRFRWPRC